MSTFALRMTAPERLHELYEREAPQKDHLCGAFWGALALRAAGIDSVAGEPIDQDLIAREARTTLEDGDPYASLPPGASPRLDYRIRPPTAADPRVSGTSAASLRKAIERCAGDTLSAVPIAGPWTEQSVTTLFEAVAEPGSDHMLIANLRTGKLWGTRPDPSQLLAYLACGQASGPPSEWDVGHFVALSFAVVSGERSVVGVLDTYPSLGWKGHHLQPAVALAAALHRGDGREGGVIYVSPKTGDDITAKIEAKGFALRDWDNGSI